MTYSNIEKHRLTRVLYWFLQWTWGIVQNICGLVVFLILKVKNPNNKLIRYNGAIISQWSVNGSMGLGMFIFDGHQNKDDHEETIVHEYGHTVQSAILGPLFIPLIGIPSFIWANFPYFVRLRKRKKISYMNLYCEKWASNWGERVVQNNRADEVTNGSITV